MARPPAHGDFGLRISITVGLVSVVIVHAEEYSSSPGAGFSGLPPLGNSLVQGSVGSTFPPWNFSQVVLSVDSGLWASQLVYSKIFTLILVVLAVYSSLMCVDSSLRAPSDRSFRVY